jgi:hypothetical protein
MRPCGGQSHSTELKAPLYVFGRRCIAFSGCSRGRLHCLRMHQSVFKDEERGIEHTITGSRCPFPRCDHTGQFRMG